MSKNGASFSVNQVGAMARYVAELTRQGVTFEITTMVDGWVVTTTGGY